MNKKFDSVNNAVCKRFEQQINRQIKKEDKMKNIYKDRKAFKKGLTRQIQKRG